MYTIAKDTKLSPDIIRKAIEYNQKLVPKLKELADYYDGEHPILSRKKDEDRFSNVKAVVNHAEYITDLKVGYLVGKPITYSLGKDYAKYDISNVLNEFKEQEISLIDQEVAINASKFGYAYERIYLDGNNVRSVSVDPRNCVMIYDNTVQHKKIAAILYELKEGVSDMSQAKYSMLEVLDTTNTYNLLDTEGKLLEAMPVGEAHKFTGLPVIHIKNKQNGKGDYQNVTSLIDCYNILISDRTNNIVQLVESILAIKAMDWNEEATKLLNKSRIIANIPSDGAVEFLTKELNEEQVTILQKDLEDCIHKISKTPNMTDKDFASTASGVSLKFKILPFDLDTTNKEMYFTKAIRERFIIYNNYLASISKGSKELKGYMINAIFTRSLPQNDLETSQIIANTDGKITTQTAIGQLSFIDDPETEAEAALKESKDKAEAFLGDSNFGDNTPSGNDNSKDNTK